MLLNPLTIHTPKTLPELRELYGQLENVRLQAGGTFLLNALKLQKRNSAKTPAHVITLNKVAELKGIEMKGESLIIKSMTTIDELFDSALLKDNFNVLHTVCRNISTQPIRNMATVGGNLTCRYTWTEMPAAMTGLRARLHFVGKDGATEELGCSEFFQNAAKTDKILTHVSIPLDQKATIAYRRVKKSQFVDIPLLSLMINTHIANGVLSDTIVAVNNCVDFAQRDKKLEDFLNGKKISKTLGAEALEHLTNEIYDRRSGEYKKQMFRVNIKSAINEIAKS
jgi:CO/xanthine dehydrogenase FAD-binding subunit